ncbi:hypothetical protein [Chryseobacterium flavum]|uniref:hypothetical protein n=1 Tax=Chryseobacterium flavum TaxID=415851 RepID=UPI0028AC0AB2|nr:hypothetical protein [Chryseobacterium flavum]
MRRRYMVAAQDIMHLARLKKSIFMTIGVITITKAGVVDITNRRKIKALIFQGFSF